MRRVRCDRCLGSGILPRMYGDNKCPECQDGFVLIKRDTPTYNGARPDRGKIIVGSNYPKEGYAIIKCGNTELQVGYTLLVHLRILLEKDCPMWGELAELSRLMDSITCEASLGRQG